MKVWNWIVVGLVGVGIGWANGDVIWNEDFSDLSDWFIVSNPGGDGSMNSDGSYGTFSEPSSGISGLTFAPTTRAAFDPTQKETYSMEISIVSLTWSASHKWALDEFDSSGTYIGTVWDIYPTNSAERSTLGFDPSGPVTTNISLGNLTFDSATAYIAPKFDIGTGDGGQSFVLDNLAITQTIPEPATMNLIGLTLGSALLAARRRISRR